MTSIVEQTREPKFRGVFRIRDITVVVKDSDELVIDSAYASEVPELLRDFWEKGDYFDCFRISDDGEVTDSISGMAGYGGPNAAAKAAVEDYFQSESSTNS